MHELWLCRSILDIVKQNAAGQSGTYIKKIVLELGQLAAVEKEALLFGFNVIKEGTVAERAELLIMDIPGEALCESCQTITPLRQYYDACQHCGSHSLTVTQGEELRVKSMVVE